MYTYTYMYNAVVVQDCPAQLVGMRAKVKQLMEVREQITPAPF